MNKKTALTVAAFSLPLVVLVALSVSTPAPQRDAKKLVPVARKASDDSISKREIERRIKQISSRLETLKKMTQKEWDEEGVRLGDRAKNRPATKEQAIKLNEDMLKKYTTLAKQKNASNGAKANSTPMPNKASVPALAPAADKAPTAPAAEKTMPMPVSSRAPAPAAAEPEKKN